VASLYLGLISGTSADGIDAALVRFEPRLEIVGALTYPYRDELRAQILALATSNASVALDDYGALDVAIGEAFADATHALLGRTFTAPADVAAIGSHGQTVRHRPSGEYPFTMQIGDPTVIAERTGITTIADFRRADVAAGGQGAPLLPALHAAVFASDQTRIVLNLGGIANITVLAPGRDVLGFDTGPANCLLDAWAHRHRGVARDEGGAWANSGRVDREQLAAFLSDPYFAMPPPKSTGREHFNLDWLDARVRTGIAPENVQATLLALSADTIANAIRATAPDAREIFACGGGVHNPALMQAIAERVAPATLASTTTLGLDPDYVEAAGFAWLARARLANEPGNIPAVTGARGPRVLGAIHPAPGPNESNP
jgi:anhydro-N-acetylmuramic acid kinase